VAEFEITQVQIDEIANQSASGEKVLKDFTVDVKDSADDIVARITKTLYVRKKRT